MNCLRNEFDGEIGFITIYHGKLLAKVALA